MTLILGIDPGSNITGYGVIRQSGQHIDYVTSGCIRTNLTDLPSRLKLIYIGISEIIAKFLPECFVIEEIFMSKNADSALKLGQTRGAAIVAAANFNLPIFGYTSRRVKQTVAGVGNAKKQQVQNMVRSLLKLSGNPPTDAADALAIAITHCHVSQNKVLIDKKLILTKGRLQLT